MKTKINVIVNGNFSEQQKHLEQVLRSQGVLNTYYNFIDVSEINSFFKMKSERIKHCPELDSYAYEIIIDDETTYYYLGDNNDIEFFSKKIKQLRTNDFLFTDISNKITNVHLNLSKIAEITNPEIRNQIYLMHFNSADTICESKELGFNVAIEE